VAFNLRRAVLAVSWCNIAPNRSTAQMKTMKETAKQKEISKILARLLIESRNHGHVYLPVGLREELQRLTLKELQQTEFHVR
jgi:hypothetical protein